MSKKKSRKPNAKDLEYIFACKRMSCMVCDAPAPVEFHHIVDCGSRLGHPWGFGLCVRCHRGDDGFSGKNRGAWDKSLLSQLKLCQKSYRRLDLEMPVPQSKVVDYEALLQQ